MDLPEPEPAAPAMPVVADSFDAELDAALGRLLTDADFRNAFFASPLEACATHGLDLAASTMTVLAELGVAEFAAAAAGLDRCIVRAAGGSLSQPRALHRR